MPPTCPGKQSGQWQIVEQGILFFFLLLFLHATAMLNTTISWLLSRVQGGSHDVWPTSNNASVRLQAIISLSNSSRRSRMDRSSSRSSNMAEARIPCLSEPLESRFPVQSIQTWSNGFPASCDVHAVPEHSKLYGYSNPCSSRCSRRGEANLENIAAHQRYLEKLQFEMNTLRSWSNIIQDQIMGEARRVHLQMMRMIHELQRESDPQPWA